MSNTLFVPEWSIFSDKKITATQEQIRQEPMLFNADMDYAWKNGGSLTRDMITIMDEIMPSGGGIVDTRSHMLMPGQYPCIPGWHLDSIPRNSEGQPDIRVKSYASHLLCVVGPTAMTEFLAEPVDLAGYDQSCVYGSCHTMIERMQPETKQISSGNIFRFGSRDWHRGTEATERCWRWFIRVSYNDGRTPKNEVRTQVQVYADPSKGW